MRHLARLTLFLFLAAAAFGQHRGFGGGFRGYGGGFRGGGVYRGGFGFAGHRPFFGGGYRFSHFGYWPYSYPIFVGGYWDGGYPYYDYGYPYAYGYGYGGPNIQIVSAYAPPAPPVESAPIVIEHHVQSAPPRSVIREYTPTGEPKPGPKAESKPALYLIAFKDSVIYAAEAYWVDGGTLHYVTLKHESKQVPLSKVDRELSDRLNSERNVQFHLPR